MCSAGAFLSFTHPLNPPLPKLPPRLPIKFKTAHYRYMEHFGFPQLAKFIVQTVQFGPAEPFLSGLCCVN